MSYVLPQNCLYNIDSPVSLTFCGLFKKFKEGANKRVISSQVGSPIKFSRVWTGIFSRKHPNQPI